MADAPVTSSNDPGDKEFRRKNLWYSFTSAMYGVIGGAALFGMANQLAGTVIQAASGETAAMAIFSNPVVLATVAAMAAVGIVATYLAQRELTEQKVIQDEHLACMNAKQMGMSHTPLMNVARQQEVPAHNQTTEFPQNCRADGKPWAKTIECDADKTVAR